MGNDRRKNIKDRYENRTQKDTFKEKTAFLEAITKLIADWIKTFPNDNGSVNLLNKLYKRVEFDGVSTTTKNNFNDFLNKYNKKTK
jgi:hypothetical protein